MVITLGKVAAKTFQNYKRRAQAKINRLKKKGFDVSPYLNFDLKPTFNTRKEYNNWKKEIDRFTNRNNSDFKIKKSSKGFSYLGVEKKTLERKTKEAISRAQERQDELNKLPSIDYQGKVVGTVGETRKVLKDKERGFVKKPTELSIDDLPSRNALEKRIETMIERASSEHFIKRDSQMRENWVSIMRIAFGDDADSLISKVEKMDLTDFIEMYWIFREMKFEIYDSETGYNGDDEKGQLEELETTVDNYNKIINSNDLKGFR